MGFLFNLFLIFLLYKFVTKFLLGPSSDSRQQRFDYKSISSFEDALLSVMAAAMKADGRVTKPELDVVKRILLETYGEKKAQVLLHRLRDILKTNVDVKTAAMTVASMLTYNSRLTIINLLCQITEADGIITSSEVQTITNIAFWLGLSRHDILKIQKRLHVNGGERGGSNTNGGYSQSGASSGVALDKAYATLGIKSDATNEDLKTAYRNMVKKYHPDRFATQGADAQAKAETKFKEIQTAYEKIKAARGL